MTSIGGQCVFQTVAQLGDLPTYPPSAADNFAGASWGKIVGDVQHTSLECGFAKLDSPWESVQGPSNYTKYFNPCLLTYAHHTQNTGYLVDR